MRKKVYYSKSMGKAFAFLLAFHFLIGGSAAQTPCHPASTWSSAQNQFVIDTDFYYSGRFYDMDYKAGSLAIAPTFNPGSKELLLAKGAPTGQYDWFNKVSFGATAIKEVSAVKIAANGDYIGTGVTAANDVFVFRANSSGVMQWIKSYPNAAMPAVSAKVGELSSGDIAVCAYSTAGNRIGVIRTDNSGNVLNYKTYTFSGRAGVYAADLVPFNSTLSSGFVVLGSSGQAGDYFGGLYIIFDNSCTLKFAKVIRRVLGSYSLSSNATSSCVYLNAGMITNNVALMAGGWFSDHNAAGTGASFTQGAWTMINTFNGAYLMNQAYIPPAPGDQCKFYDIDADLATGRVALTGSHLSGGVEKTLLVVSNGNSTSIPIVRNVFGLNAVNSGMDVFITPGGYLVSGITNDYNAAKVQPTNITTDGSGNNGCQTEIEYTQSTEFDTPAFSALAVSPAENLFTITAVNIYIAPGPPVIDNFGCIAVRKLCGADRNTLPCRFSSPLSAAQNQFVINDDFYYGGRFYDVDYKADSIIMAPTLNPGTRELVLNKATPEGQYNWFNKINFGTTTIQEVSAVKFAANGDYIGSGITTNKDVFIFRASPNGSMLWVKTYPNSTAFTAAGSKLGELSSGDIAVCAYNTFGNTIAVLRTNNAGSLLNYKTYAFTGRTGVYAGDLVPFNSTLSSGFAILGSNGQAGDYFGGLYMIFDNSCTLKFADVIRRTLSSYNLGSNATSSCVYLNAGVITNNVGLMVCGWDSDHNAAGTGASFTRGLWTEINTFNGAYLTINQEYLPPSASDQCKLYDIDVDYATGRIALTGSHISGGVEKNLLLVSNGNTTSAPLVSNIFGANSINSGLDVFITPGGYFISGITNDYNPAKIQPTNINTDASGNNGCETLIDYKQTTEFNEADLSALKITPLEKIYSINPVAVYVADDFECLDIEQLCGGGAGGRLSSSSPAGNTKKTGVLIYPNPVSSQFNIVPDENGSADLLEVYNVMGQLVSRQQLGAEKEINVSARDWTNGVYIIKLYQSGKVLSTARLIKQN